MAGFTHFNRKAVLLYDKLVQLGFTDGNKRISAIGHLTLNTIRNWRRVDARYAAPPGVDVGLKTLLNISESRNLLADAVSVKEFSRLLGYDIQAGRQLIDQAYNELYPTYSLLYSAHRTAKDLLDRFQGFHLVYRLESGERVKEFTHCENNIIQMPLVVRYSIRGHTPSTEKQFRVRCKLNVPSYTVKTPFFEYDGYITPQKHDTHYWLFENRSSENKDWIFMITDSLQMLRQPFAGGFRERAYAQGIMITRRQDAQSIHKIWNIVLLKTEPDDSGIVELGSAPDSESAFMISQCKPVSNADVPPWVADKLAEGWKAIDFSSLAGC